MSLVAQFLVFCLVSIAAVLGWIIVTGPASAPRSVQQAPRGVDEAALSALLSTLKTTEGSLFSAHRVDGSSAYLTINSAVYSKLAPADQKACLEQIGQIGILGRCRLVNAWVNLDGQILGRVRSGSSGQEFFVPAAE